MAIQMRRGDYPDLVKSQLVDGELAVVLSGDPGPDDGRAMYVCFGSTTKRVATWEDAAQIIAETIGDALDITIASGDSALLVSSSESGGETAYSIAHRSRSDRDAQGLDPGSSSGGGYDVMGVSILDYGDGFFIPCVSCDRYGHVTGIEYRRLVLPSSFPTATLANAGAVMPDGSTIKITQSGVISVPMASSTRSGLLSAAMYSAIAWMDETGMPVVSSYIVGSTAYDDEWLSESEGGEPLMPYEDHIYVIVSSGEHQNEMYRWDGNQYQPLSRTPDLATTTSAGIVQPDGTSIDVTDGIISIGTIPSSALPSYVDDVLEYPTTTDFPAEGESGKIYVATSTNETYRWSGSAYVSISNPLDYATQAEAEAGVENSHVMTPLRVAQAIDPVRGAVADLAADMPSVATTSEAGLVIPDGTTITVDSDGTIHGASTYELPTMSPTTKGGALLGRGLEIEDGVLSVATEGDGAIRSVTAEGWAEQDGTPSPSPSFPQEIQVARGRNLLYVDPSEYPTTKYGVTFTMNSDGSITASGTATANAFLDFGRYSLTVPAGTYHYALANGSGFRQYVYEQGESSATLIREDAGAFTLDHEASIFCRFGVISGTTANATIYPQLELGSTATPYVPYGYVGLEVRTQATLYKSGRFINEQGVESDLARYAIYSVPAKSGRATVEWTNGNTTDTVRIHGYDADGSWVAQLYVQAPTANGVTYCAEMSVPSNVTEIRITSNAVTSVYARLSTIPIPLPSKGFAAALPDGTCDTLTIDGAGHVEWENATAEYVVTGTEGNGKTIAANGEGYYRCPAPVLTAQSKTGLGVAGYCSHSAFANDTTTGGYRCWTTGAYLVFVSTEDTGAAIWQRYAGAEVLYPLASPTTEDCGYVDLAITVEGDTVDIPELEDVAVVRWADTVATEVAQTWYRRSQAVESRVAALEAAVAEIATS